MVYSSPCPPYHPGNSPAESIFCQDAETTKPLKCHSSRRMLVINHLPSEILRTNKQTQQKTPESYPSKTMAPNPSEYYGGTHGFKSHMVSTEKYQATRPPGLEHETLIKTLRTKNIPKRSQCQVSTSLFSVSTSL